MAHKYWITADGTEIKIADMDDRHLENTIKMLERKWQENMSAGYSIDAFLQGDMASYFHQRDLEIAEEMGIENVVPVYKALKKEQERRTHNVSKIRKENQFT